MPNKDGVTITLSPDPGESKGTSTHVSDALNAKIVAAAEKYEIPKSALMREILEPIIANNGDLERFAFLAKQKREAKLAEAAVRLRELQQRMVAEKNAAKASTNVPANVPANTPETRLEKLELGYTLMQDNLTRMLAAMQNNQSKLDKLIDDLGGHYSNVSRETSNK